MPSGPSMEIQNAGPARSIAAGSSINNYGSSTQSNNTGAGTQYVQSGAGHQYNAQNQYIKIQSSPRPDSLQECQKSLAFPEMNNRPNDIDDAVDGTCEWLPRHETYRDWAGRHRGLLWIKGKPGSGKSTLLKHVLQRVETEPSMGDTAIILSFFFHGRGGELQRTPLGLFRSLLHQLLARVPDSLSLLVDTFQQRCDTVGMAGEKWQWHARELPAFFESSLPKVLERRSVWLFVDALDECGEENAIHLVDYFKLFIKKLSPTTSRFRICFSCRHYPILELDYGSAICLEHENTGDITAFVQTQLSTLCIRSAS